MESLERLDRRRLGVQPKSAKIRRSQFRTDADP
jgi:hypothetical protein